MKSLDKLRQILNDLNLSDARKADLVNKYKNASVALRTEMNKFFSIKNTEESPSKNHNKPDSKAYYGSNARNIDHRARPTPDLHLEADKSLENEYFKNS